MVRTFSEPAIESLEEEREAPRTDAPELALAQQVERLRRIIDELAAVLRDND